MPLRILASPKASNEADRLDQTRLAARRDKARVLGYGELPPDPSAELGGRAFYLHQPESAKQPRLYRCHPNEAEERKIIQDKQASLARFISSPGAQFGVTIRFRDLRLWELGALMTALSPNLLAQPGAPWAEPDNKTPDYAIKLGHGRPLGLGSVRVDIDSLHQIDPGTGVVDTDADLGAAALDAFSALPIDAKVRAKWLDVHRYKGRTRAVYPSVTEHADRSKKQASNRRMSKS